MLDKELHPQRVHFFQRNIIICVVIAVTNILLLSRVSLLGRHVQGWWVWDMAQSAASHGPSPIILPSASNHVSETNNDSAMASSFETNDWPELKEKLCPSMKPNRNAWQTIFRLARMEMNFEKLTDEPVTFEEDFFRFNAGGTGYANLVQSDAASMVYLRIWKAGNDFVRFNMEESIKSMNEANGNTNGYSLHDAWYNQAILYKKMGIIQPRHAAKESAKPPCIITVVRDPVSHFLSAYNEVEFRSATNPKEERLPKLGDKDTPPLLFTRFKTGSQQRFRQFVVDFIGGPNRAGFANPTAELSHLYSMTGILYGLDQVNECYGPKAQKLHREVNSTTPLMLQHELHMTAYLPSLENLSSSFPDMIATKCQGLPPALGKPFEKEVGQHPSQKDKLGFYKAAKQVWSEGGDVARSLCALHVLDYACYDKVPIPELCKQVYAQEIFKKEVVASLDDDDNKNKHRRNCDNLPKTK